MLGMSSFNLETFLHDRQWRKWCWRI